MRNIRGCKKRGKRLVCLLCLLCITVTLLASCISAPSYVSSDELAAAKKALTQEIEALKARNEAAEAELGTLRENYEAAQSQIGSLTAGAEAAQREIDELKENENAAREELDTLKESYEAAREELDTLKESYEAAREELDTLKESYEAAREELDTLKESYEAAREEIGTLKENYEAAQESLDTLKENYDAACEEIERLKAQIEALQNGLVPEEPIEKIRIYIDQGHNPTGYHNTGASGNGLYEADLTFTIGTLLAEILEADGRFAVCLSRPTATTVLGTDNTSSLAARVQGAKDFEADYFVSLHTNAYELESANGIEVLVAQEDSESYAFGSCLLEKLVAATGLNERSMQLRPELHVLKNATMPAALVEMGFITNADDAALLSENPALFADGLYAGILAYFGLSTVAP